MEMFASKNAVEVRMYECFHCPTKIQAKRTWGVETYLGSGDVLGEWALGICGIQMSEKTKLDPAVSAIVFVEALSTDLDVC